LHRIHFDRDFEVTLFPLNLFYGKEPITEDIKKMLRDTFKGLKEDVAIECIHQER